MKATLIKPDASKAKEFFEQKMSFTTGPVELERLLNEQREEIVLVDVREEEDYRKGHIPGALNLPKEKWDSLEGLDKEKTNIIYCYSQVCHLAANAAHEFAGKGYPVMELEGGFETWKEHDLKVEKTSLFGMGRGRGIRPASEGKRY